MKAAFRQVQVFLEMIKFEHSIFALPFAYLGMALAGHGLPSLRLFLLVTVAMVAARTVAMSFNRLADLRFDAANPRTNKRPLVTGALKPGVAWGATFLSLAALAVTAWLINPFVFAISPLAALLLFGYSFTKRFTWLSHFVLGFTDAASVAGAWAAVRASLFTHADLPIWTLVGTVTVWIAGFDLIYACQDYQVDIKLGLHSIPARFGIPFALQLARILHILTVLGFLVVGWQFNLGWIYWPGTLLSAALLTYEHSIISPKDLSRVNLAFFNVNGYISILMFFFTFFALKA